MTDQGFNDDFSGPTLDPGRWVAHYLPQWTTPERSAARYVLDDRGLCLLIEAGQPAWRPEEGPMRVSNIQTGTFSGPVGSAVGQHRHVAGLTVRTAQATRRLWTPSSGEVEVIVAASPDPTCMLGIWLVGFEEEPEHSGEICIAELFGDRIGAGGSVVNVGVKAHHDPRLRTEMAEVAVPVDATGPHRYRAEWDADGVRCFIDDRAIWRTDQVLDYPLQLMIDLFEFPSDERRDPRDYPKVGVLRSVRGRSGRSD